MTVKEFIKYDKIGCMYKVVDATQRGYMSDPKILLDADRNVVMNQYGDCELVGFAPSTKTSIFLYIKPDVNESAPIDKILAGVPVREALAD